MARFQPLTVTSRSTTTIRARRVVVMPWPPLKGAGFSLSPQAIPDFPPRFLDGERIARSYSICAGLE